MGFTWTIIALIVILLIAWRFLGAYMAAVFACRDDDAGAGLGLAIAKTFVEAHGQRIWVEDAPSGGARFCFTLPVAAPLKEPITQESQLAASSHH
jgi:hypothetical protein